MWHYTLSPLPYWGTRFDPQRLHFYYYYYYLGNTQLEYYKYMVFNEQKTYKDL